MRHSMKTRWRSCWFYHVLEKPRPGELAGIALRRGLKKKGSASVPESGFPREVVNTPLSRSGVREMNCPIFIDRSFVFDFEVCYVSLDVGAHRIWFSFLNSYVIVVNTIWLWSELQGACHSEQLLESLLIHFSGSSFTSFIFRLPPFLCDVYLLTYLFVRLFTRSFVCLFTCPSVRRSARSFASPFLSCLPPSHLP